MAPSEAGRNPKVDAWLREQPKLRHAKDLKPPAVKALLRAAWRLDQEGA